MMDGDTLTPDEYDLLKAGDPRVIRLKECAKRLAETSWYEAPKQHIPGHVCHIQRRTDPIYKERLALRDEMKKIREQL